MCVCVCVCVCVFVCVCVCVCVSAMLHCQGFAGGIAMSGQQTDLERQPPACTLHVNQSQGLGIVGTREHGHCSTLHHLRSVNCRPQALFDVPVDLDSA